MGPFEFSPVFLTIIKFSALFQKYCTWFLKMEHDFSKWNKISQNGTWFLKMEHDFSKWNTVSQNGIWFYKMEYGFSRFAYISMKRFEIPIFFISTMFSHGFFVILSDKKKKFGSWVPSNLRPVFSERRSDLFSSCWMMGSFSYKGTCSDLTTVPRTARLHTVFMTTLKPEYSGLMIIVMPGFGFVQRPLPSSTSTHCNVRPFMCTSPRLSVW